MEAQMKSRRRPGSSSRGRGRGEQDHKGHDEHRLHRSSRSSAQQKIRRSKETASPVSAKGASHDRPAPARTATAVQGSASGGKGPAGRVRTPVPHPKLMPGCRSPPTGRDARAEESRIRPIQPGKPDTPQCPLPDPTEQLTCFQPARTFHLLISRPASPRADKSGLGLQAGKSTQG